jgi:hypothetical protein
MRSMHIARPITLTRSPSHAFAGDLPPWHRQRLAARVRTCRGRVIRNCTPPIAIGDTWGRGSGHLPANPNPHLSLSLSFSFSRGGARNGRMHGHVALCYKAKPCAYCTRLSGLRSPGQCAFAFCITAARRCRRPRSRTSRTPPPPPPRRPRRRRCPRPRSPSPPRPAGPRRSTRRRPAAAAQTR